VSSSTPIEFRVAGIPVPQGSKATHTTKAGQTFSREANRNLGPWRNAIAAAASEAMAGRPPLDGPLLLEATFNFPRPKSHYRTGRHVGEVKASAPVWCTTRPDLDKLLRAVGDAITGYVCHDDAQLVEVEAVKAYGPPGLWAVVYTIGGS